MIAALVQIGLLGAPVVFYWFGLLSGVLGPATSLTSSCRRRSFWRLRRGPARSRRPRRVFRRPPRARGSARPGGPHLAEEAPSGLVSPVRDPPRGGAAATDPLAGFSEPVRDWFAEALGEPTPIQRLAWPRIAAGEHVLVTAPTGSGKTLAAFLWAIDRLLSGAWSTGAVRVLYVSPLKALGNDIRRNLARAARRACRERLPTAPAWSCPRSGSRSAPATPRQDERRRMRAAAARDPHHHPGEPQHPAHLAPRAGDAARRSQTVILDEIHAVVGGKRGVHLITAVERLGAPGRRAPAHRPVGHGAAARAGGPLGRRRHARGPARRRATRDRPRRGGGRAAPAAPGRAARGPRRRRSRRRRAAPRRRAVERASSPSCRRPSPATARPWSSPTAAAWSRSSHAPGQRGRRAASSPTPTTARSSREIRDVVEERLKAGSCAASSPPTRSSSASTSAPIDEVVLVQSPPSVASAVQRLGRAGHAVGATSRGRLLTLAPARPAERRGRGPGGARRRHRGGAAGHRRRSTCSPR